MRREAIWYMVRSLLAAATIALMIFGVLWLRANVTPWFALIWAIFPAWVMVKAASSKDNNHQNK